ncbi:hypothetical protein CHCC20441_1220 [Bacillus licheniformis]|uniref:Uncharacterized protein n=1 Tax=Bacillus licheniformis TaxID=1402 RepID=A0A8B5YIK5_BACLI|nr:hypothetical protein B4091_3404 [Bacillus licheniformis]TWJ48086.1 hypothetical protein CHCC5025_0883 [Bacillus licheniformis]TWK01106.1 hypothetical protein CHCC20442_1097 [Bacillus licheniformis]TWK01663.1 hypothetical protein CHCC20441_1220 [Bacillus licheniformis]TWK14424.1 hypothetical protein CHCC20440_1490 [Bacillus licheniformis]
MSKMNVHLPYLIPLSILTSYRKNNLKKAVNNKKQNGVNERWFSG